MRGNPEGRKDGLYFLVHWVGFDTPTGNLGGMSADRSLSINTSALIGMRSAETRVQRISVIRVWPIPVMRRILEKRRVVRIDL
jgi:hypothetical protein